ncbi:MAG: peptidylprolyl isomerase [Clostridia bacterium]|nr:peptidylprolyl isomerase [Clostridia bacterium]
MGKGNRNRNDRYEDVYSMSGSGTAVKAPRAGAKKDRTTTLLITVIAVLLLASLAIYIFSDSGILERNTVYVSSENFAVTGTMLPYYENLAYSSTFEQYYALYYNYVYSGDATQAYNAVAQMMSGYVLSDFFDSAIATSKEMVALAEEAHKNGVALDEEELAEIEDTLKSSSAASLGAGVKKKDLRAALELQALAVKYAEMVDEEIELGVTKDEILAFVEENKSDYYSADILKYELSLLAEDYEGDELGYAKAEKLLDYYAEKLLTTDSVDSFKDLVIAYEVYSNFDALVDSNRGSLDMPSEELAERAKSTMANRLYNAIVAGEEFNSTLTEDATYAEVFETVANKLLATCTSAVANLDSSEKYTESADDEVLAWLSAADTKALDTKMAEESTDKEYTKTVYMVTEPMHLDERETRDVAHILIKAARTTATAEQKADAKTKADAVLATFRAGEQTLEAFEKLAETNNEDSGCVYEGVTKGQMVKDFEDWMFDEARKAGDTGVVETEFGYHVMYYIGEGEAAYHEAALSSYVSEAYTKRVEKMIEETVVLNEKAIAKKTNVTDETSAESAA